MKRRLHSIGTAGPQTEEGMNWGGEGGMGDQHENNDEYIKTN